MPVLTDVVGPVTGCLGHWRRALGGQDCSSPTGLGGDHTALRAMTSPVFALENLICILGFSFSESLECGRICEGLQFAECVCGDD